MQSSAFHTPTPPPTLSHPPISPRVFIRQSDDSCYKLEQPSRINGRVVLGKVPVLGRPTIWIRVGQGPTVPAADAGGSCLVIFSLVYHFSFLSPSLWETALYRLQYCLKGPLSPNQPSNPFKNKKQTFAWPLFAAQISGVLPVFLSLTSTLTRVSPR